MIWLAAVLFVAVGVAMIVARVPLGRGQDLIMGGRMGPGCVIAEAVVFFVLAALLVIFRDLLS